MRTWKSLEVYTPRTMALKNTVTAFHFPFHSEMAAAFGLDLSLLLWLFRLLERTLVSLMCTNKISNKELTKAESLLGTKIPRKTKPFRTVSVASEMKDAPDFSPDMFKWLQNEGHFCCRCIAFLTKRKGFMSPKSCHALDKGPRLVLPQNKT